MRPAYLKHRADAHVRVGGRDELPCYINATARCKVVTEFSTCETRVLRSRCVEIRGWSEVARASCGPWWLYR